jgi:mRNA interferase RelE/StbE
MYSIFYTEEAKSLIEKLPAKRQRQIKNAAERLANNPFLGKGLTQELTGMWSYRSGDFRIIYRIERNKMIIIVLTLGYRKDIYKKISRRKA